MKDMNDPDKEEEDSESMLSSKHSGDDSSSGSGLGAGSSSGNSGSNSSTTPMSQSGGSSQGRSGMGSIPEAIYATKENLLVNRSRLLVIGVLVCCAAAAGVMAYVLTKKSETSDFETQVCTSLFCLEKVL